MKRWPCKNGLVLLLSFLYFLCSSELIACNASFYCHCFCFILFYERQKLIFVTYTLYFIHVFYMSITNYHKTNSIQKKLVSKLNEIYTFNTKLLRNSTFSRNNLFSQSKSFSVLYYDRLTGNVL